MGVDANCILMTNTICVDPELIQILAFTKETALFTRGSAQTGIAVNTMTVCLQVPDVISPVAHDWLSIRPAVLVPFATCARIDMHYSGVDTVQTLLPFISQVMAWYIDLNILTVLLCEILFEMLYGLCGLACTIVIRTANLGDLLSARSEKQPVRQSFSNTPASYTDRNVGRSVFPDPATSVVLSERETKL